jgi:hypothetical protein
MTTEHLEPTDVEPAVRGRLDDWRARLAADPERIRSMFPAAAREIGRDPASTDPGRDRLEDRVRVALLMTLATALAGEPERLATEVRDLYRFGDADERRAVVLALHATGLGDDLVDLVHDALRTNDPRLVAAAMGPVGAASLDDDAWRQGVLKCLFTEVPLTLVAELDRRTDPRLRGMVEAYAAERAAAGRELSPDVLRMLDAAGSSFPST